jgi:hypothetical protein
MMTGIMMVSVMFVSFSRVEGQPTTASATTTATTSAAVPILGISDSMGYGGSHFLRQQKQQQLQSWG